MTAVLVVLVGTLIGFVASRAARRGLGSRSQRGPVGTASSVARNVGGALGRSRTLSAPELQRACFSEMIRHVQHRRGGAPIVPAAYVLRLHPDDAATVGAAPRWFTDGLVDALRQAAQDHGWALDGTPSIEIEADPARRPGVPAALPATAAGPATVTDRPGASTGASSPGASSLVRADTGARHWLGGDVVTIGRGRDRDLLIDDRQVSRAHASIRRTDRGWTVADDGSSNGTRLNGRDLPAGDAHLLRAGDRLEIGPVTLTFELGPAGDAGGDRPLDDATRTRISEQVLPPGGASRRP